MQDDPPDGDKLVQPQRSNKPLSGRKKKDLKVKQKRERQAQNKLTAAAGRATLHAHMHDSEPVSKTSEKDTSEGNVRETDPPVSEPLEASAESSGLEPSPSDQEHVRSDETLPAESEEMTPLEGLEIADSEESEAMPLLEGMGDEEEMPPLEPIGTGMESLLTSPIEQENPVTTGAGSSSAPSSSMEAGQPSAPPTSSGTGLSVPTTSTEAGASADSSPAPTPVLSADHAINTCMMIKGVESAENMMEIFYQQAQAKNDLAFIRALRSHRFLELVVRREFIFGTLLLPGERSRAPPPKPRRKKVNRPPPSSNENTNRDIRLFGDNPVSGFRADAGTKMNKSITESYQEEVTESSHTAKPKLSVSWADQDEEMESSTLTQEEEDCLLQDPKEEPMEAESAPSTSSSEEPSSGISNSKEKWKLPPQESAHLVKELSYSLKDCLMRPTYPIPKAHRTSRNQRARDLIRELHNLCPRAQVLSNLPGHLVTALPEDSPYRIDERAIPRSSSRDSRRNIPESRTPYTDFRRSIPDNRSNHSDYRRAERRPSTPNETKSSSQGTSTIQETRAPSRNYRSMGARPKTTTSRAPAQSQSTSQPCPPAANASRLAHQDLEVGSILNMGGYYLIRTITGWASSEVDPLVDPTRMRQTNPVAFRQAPSAAAGSAQTAAPSPPKASTSRIPVPTVTSQATTFRPVPKPRTSLSITSRQPADEATVRNPAETRLTTPPRPAPRARPRTPQPPLRGHSPIRPPTRTRSPSRVRSRSPFRGNSPSRGRASTRDLAPQHPRGRSQSRTNLSVSAPLVPAPRAYRGRSESRGRDRSSTPANGRKRSSSSPSPSRGPLPPKSKYRNHCPLCSERLHNVRRHHGVTHLPWYSPGMLEMPGL